MKRYTARSVRQALAGKGNLRNLLSDRIADWNPYQPGSVLHLKGIYEQEALQGWLRVRHLFSDLGSVQALENSWACIAHLPDLRDFLHTGVMLQNDRSAVQRVTQLLALPESESAEDVSLGSLLDSAANADTLDLLPLNGFSGESRIRWGLAFRVKRHASFLELLQCAGALESVPVELSSSALTEAVANCLDYTPNPLAVSDVTTLSDAEHAILVSDPFLFKTLYAQGSSRVSVAIKKVHSLRTKYASDLDLINDVFFKLSQRKWSEAGQLAANIVTDATAQLAARQVIQESGDIAWVTNELPLHKWTAMPEHGHRQLTKLFGRSNVPSTWHWDAEQLAQILVAGKLPERALSSLDIDQLGKTWTIETKRKLIAAQCYRVLEVSDPAWQGQSMLVLSEAANMRPDDGEKLLSEHLTEFKNAEGILNALICVGSKKFSLLLEDVIETKLCRDAYQNKAISWVQLLSSQIGTPAWHVAVKKKLIQKASVPQLKYAAIQDGANSRAEAFQAVALATLRCIKKATHADAMDVMQWIEARPADAGFIAQGLTPSLIQKICALEPHECTVQSIKRLYEASAVEQRIKYWQMQLNHVNHADHLIELALEGAAQGWQGQWISRWKVVEGSVQQRARALVLMNRNDLHQLRQLRRFFTDEVISGALLWASQQLPGTRPFEKIFLELSSCLGLRHGMTLRWLLSIRKREKPAGAKYDQLYARHEIPKKSGKMRLISAPIAGLKRIQKSIVVNLLDPLGAHEAAYGFVIGRSIVGNARLHVGKPLVANADVRNCFPSVRWPLVRAALIRDLSHRLSPLSISFLVDVCTSEGVLPIGAPSSPALLNRVLFKTDQILSQQADLRNCSYSRYADDITFSGGEEAVGLLGVASGVLARIGLELDPKKTNIFRRGRRQMCTGLVVNDRVNVPRTTRRKIRAAVHAFEQGRSLVWEGEPMSPSSLRGRLEFLKMVGPETAAALVQRLATAQAATKKKEIRKSAPPSKMRSA